MLVHAICTAAVVVALGSTAAMSQTNRELQAAVSIVPVRSAGTFASGSCRQRDAIVFVHGIYGSAETFKNTSTGFDFAENIPKKFDNRSIDVFRLNYKTAAIAWAKGTNPSFLEVAQGVQDAMKPLRNCEYRSVGFIAHSLGGNVVATYIHKLKSRYGHPRRSQNAFLVTLGTPVQGAQIADLASALKSALFMSDGLLESLKAGNLYLEMLQEFRTDEREKGVDHGCRGIALYAAVENKFMGLFNIVGENSAGTAMRQMVAEPVKSFDFDHMQLPKPEGKGSPVFVWVQNILEREYKRLSRWDEIARSRPANVYFCHFMPLSPEGGFVTR